MTPEGKVKSLIDTFLKRIGAWYFKPVSNGLGAHGVPDYVCCYKGLFFTIEAKAPGRRGEKHRGCSGLQVMQMEKIRAAGGLAFVVDGEEDLRDLGVRLGVTAFKSQASEAQP
jgi:hypothetical protein